MSGRKDGLTHLSRDKKINYPSTEDLIIETDNLLKINSLPCLELDAFKGEELNYIDNYVKSPLTTDCGKEFDFVIRICLEYPSFVKAGIRLHSDNNWIGVSRTRVAVSEVEHPCQTGLKDNPWMIPGTILNNYITLSTIDEDKVSTYAYQIIPHYMDAFHKSARMLGVSVKDIDNLVYKKLTSDMESVIENILIIKERLRKYEKEDLQELISNDKALLNENYMLYFSGTLVNLANISEDNVEEISEMLLDKDLLPYVLNSSRTEYLKNGFKHLKKVLGRTLNELSENDDFPDVTSDYINRLLDNDEVSEVNNLFKIGRKYGIEELNNVIKKLVTEYSNKIAKEMSPEDIGDTNKLIRIWYLAKDYDLKELRSTIYDNSFDFVKIVAENLKGDSDEDIDDLYKIKDLSEIIGFDKVRSFINKLELAEAIYNELKTAIRKREQSVGYREYIMSL